MFVIVTTNDRGDGAESYIGVGYGFYRKDNPDDAQDLLAREMSYGLQLHEANPL